MTHQDTGDINDYLRKQKERRRAIEPEEEPVEEPEQELQAPPPPQHPPQEPGEPPLPARMPDNVQYSIQAIPVDEIVKKGGIVLDETPTSNPVAGMVFGTAYDPKLKRMDGYIFLLHIESEEDEDEENDEEPEEDYDEDEEADLEEAEEEYEDDD